MHPESIQLHRLYGDLAELWPLISPPEDYAEEAAHWRAVLREKLGPGRHTILDLGAGGGHNLSHLAAEFDAVAVDLSEAMLAHSRRLNPEVEHHVGDMRTIRLGRTFDAVLLHDAINHITSERDLEATFETAAAHLRPEGVCIAAVEFMRETFVSPGVDVATRAIDDGEITSVEYTHDPDPDDTVLEVITTYFIRQSGRLRIERDRHLIGIFLREVWLRAMTDAAFVVEERTFALGGKADAYRLLIGTR